MNLYKPVVVDHQRKNSTKVTPSNAVGKIAANKAAAVQNEAN